MSDPDGDDLSGIEPLEEADSVLNENLPVTSAVTDTTESMDKTEYDSSSKTIDSADATLTSGYISRSFPSLAVLSQSLPISPNSETRTSIGKYTTIHRSAGADKENADKYRRPVGIGPRVQLFPEPGEMRRTSSEMAGIGRVIKKPNKGITRSLSSPPPGNTDGTSLCYFSRDKFFKLTPEVEPLITNDLNNNDNNATVKPSQSQDNSDPLDGDAETSAENAAEPVNSDASHEVPPLSMEQLVNLSSVSDADVQEADGNGSLDQSVESLNFQQDSDQNGHNSDTEGLGDERVPRSFYRDDDSLMGELVMDHAFKLSLATSPLSEDEDSQLCQMPPMDLQPVVYNDLERTFTGSPLASATKPNESDGSSAAERKVAKDDKIGDQDAELLQNRMQKQQVLGDSEQPLRLHEVIERLPVEEMSDQHERYEKEQLQSMTASQTSNGVNSECSSSIHGPALDPMATHDLSISSSIYSYLGKASKPQEIARQAASMKTSSPMVNRAQVQEFLQKSGNEMDSIEPLRDHVRNVLRLTESVLPDKSSYDHSEDDMLLGGYHGNNDLSFLNELNIPRSRNISYIPSYLDNLGGMRSGFLFEGQNHSNATNSSAVLMENQTLKETLEMERFRRKHVEKQIATCQSQILELQEQLAVAVSMSRKKDGMIEQLDKALAKVANGWKRKDAESKELVKQLQQENEMLNTRGQQRQEMAAKLERELSAMVEKRKQEQQRTAQVEEETEKQIKEQRELMNRNLEKLKQAEERLRTITDERDVLYASKDRLQGQLLDLRQALDSERESWEEKEKEYLQKIDEITVNHLKSVDQEKRKTTMAVQTLEDTEGILTTVQNEMTRLGMQLESATREKESLKVEMGIHEARYESARRKLEADLRGDYEKQMSQKLSEAHKRQAKSDEEIRERHRRQVVELNARHAQEVEELNRQYEEEVRDKDEKIRQLSMESDEKLSEATEELGILQSEIKTLEGQRQEMTTKLQEMMQAHCSEALRLLQIGSLASYAAQEAILTTSLPQQSSKFGMQTSVSMATTETSWSTPTIVSSTTTKSSAQQGPQDVSVWNNSALSSLPTGNSTKEEFSEHDDKHGRYSDVQVPAVSNSQFDSTSTSQDPSTIWSTSQAPPTSWFPSQALPTSWFPSQAPPTSWSTSQAQPSSWSSSQAPPTSWSTSQAPPTSWFPSQAPPTSWSTSQAPPSSWSSSQAPPTSWFTSQAPPPSASQNSGPTLQDAPLSSFTSSYLAQQSASSAFSGLLDFQGPSIAKVNNRAESQYPQSQRSEMKPVESQAQNNTLFDYGSHLNSKYSQPFGYQAPSTSDQTPPIVFHSSIGNASDQGSINGGSKSFEYQVPPTEERATESFKQNSNDQEFQLSYREDGFKSYINNPASSHSNSAHQELPPPMFTSSPPRGRGYGAPRPLPRSSGSSQGSNFLRQLVDSVEEDEFQVLREDTTIESNTEETASRASPRKVDDNSMEKEIRMQGDISGISERFHEHQNRQAELQHYIRMLLQRSPGTIPAVSSAQRSFQDEEPTRDISHGSIYSPIRIPQPDPVIMSGQGHEEVKRSAFEKKFVTAEDLPPVSGLSPKQVGEIAKLIGQYRLNPPGGQQQHQQAPPAVQSVHLRNLHQSEESTSSSEHSPPRTVIPNKANASKEPLTKDKVKKNLGVTFGEATREQIAKQEAVTKSSTGKQHQGTAAVRGPVKKVGTKSKMSDERKLLHKEKKAAKVWK